MAEYVDDNVVTGDGAQGVTDLKHYLLQECQAKNLGSLRYFLSIKWQDRRKKSFYLNGNMCLTNCLSWLVTCKDVEPWILRWRISEAITRSYGELG